MVKQRTRRSRETKRGRESRGRATRRRATRRRATRRRATRGRATRRSKKATRRIRKGGSQEKKVTVKSLPNEKNEKLENVLNECDISVIKFYMPGCPHCVDIKETWEELGKINDLEEHCKNKNCTMGVIEVNVSDYKEDIDKDYIGESQGVPHIICVKDKKVIDTFDGERNLKNFIEFAKKQK
jgi:hypothetical protein